MTSARRRPSRGRRRASSSRPPPGSASPSRGCTPSEVFGESIVGMPVRMFAVAGSPRLTGVELGGDDVSGRSQIERLADGLIGDDGIDGALFGALAVHLGVRVGELDLDALDVGAGHDADDRPCRPAPAPPGCPARPAGSRRSPNRPVCSTARAAEAASPPPFRLIVGEVGLVWLAVVLVDRRR